MMCGQKATGMGDRRDLFSKVSLGPKKQILTPAAKALGKCRCMDMALDGCFGDPCRVLVLELIHPRYLQPCTLPSLLFDPNQSF